MNEPIRVLVVEDHPSLLWGLQRLMESAGPQIVLAGMASATRPALEVLRTRHVDVVLLDIELGDECGLELIPDIRARGARVIVLSATRDAAIRRRAMRAGARACLHKEASVESILDTIVQVHAGRYWLSEDVMDGLLGASFPSRKNVHPSDELTAAERKVVATVVSRRSAPNKVIADELHISANTLRNHLANIYSKLGLHTRMDLVFYARENHLDQTAA